MRTNRKYLLALLTAIMVFNYIDRVALGLMLQDIKVDLSLSDTQLGLLTGIAFALFYSLMGIPIARWADRGNRITIISVTVAVWSAAVALCGAARSFTQLLLIRAGVAVGEAGCHPPAFSLIADHFSRAERPRAVARYMLGWPLALLLGFFAGGWLNQLYGWRTTFVLLGAPGLVLAALAALTLRESRDIRSEDPKSGLPISGLKEVLLALWSNTTYRHLLICFSLSYFFGNGILQWLPAFFVRSHGFNTGILGTWFAAIYGLGGLFGTWLGGVWVSRYASGNERLQFAAMTIVYLVLVVLSAAVYLAPNGTLALVMLALCAVGSNTINGPGFAATQTLIPPQMRAMAIAVLLFFCNLVGLGLGPLAAGVLSDALQPRFGDESLRYALLLLCPGYLWCAWHLWRARKTVARDVSAVNAAEQGWAPS